MKRLILIAMVVLMSSSITMAQEFCKGDFDYDSDVDADDVEEFLNHFGRFQFNNPCPTDGPAPVEKTGQTTCYDLIGQVIDCEGTGQDGELQRGVTLVTPRFTDNGDGTVKDNLTGLMWLKDANCFGTNLWSYALSECNGLADGQCNLTDGSNGGDWRLPNRYEIETLLDMSNEFPALPTGHPFLNVRTIGYWSSTTYADLPRLAWLVNMRNGYVDYDEKLYSLYVWCVRGGH